MMAIKWFLGEWKVSELLSSQPITPESKYKSSKKTVSSPDLSTYQTALSHSKRLNVSHALKLSLIP